MTLDVSSTTPRWSVSAMTRSLKAKGIWWLHMPWEKTSQLFALTFPAKAKAGSEKIKLCVRRHFWRLHLLRHRRCLSTELTTLLLHMLSFRSIWRFSLMSTLGWDDKWGTFNWRNYITSRLFPRLRRNEPINYAQKLVLQSSGLLEPLHELLNSISRSLAQYLISSLNFSQHPIRPFRSSDFAFSSFAV